MNHEQLLEAYRQIPTSNVCDAMQILGIPSGVVVGLRPLSLDQRRAAGFARTIKQMHRKQSAEGKSLARHSKVIDEGLNPGDMLVIDVGGRTDVCTGGGMLALRAKIRGAVGYVINGCLRDLKEIIDLDFPVHLIGGSPVKSSPALETVGVDIPVEIGGVQINPGDLVLTDDTGIVVIPVAVAEAVLKKAQEIQEAEDRLAAMVRSGKSFAEASSASGLYK